VWAATISMTSRCSHGLGAVDPTASNPTTLPVVKRMRHSVGGARLTGLCNFIDSNERAQEGHDNCTMPPLYTPNIFEQQYSDTPPTRLLPPHPHATTSHCCRRHCRCRVVPLNENLDAARLQFLDWWVGAVQHSSHHSITEIFATVAKPCSFLACSP
jgi:hypothetical protein